MIYLGIVCAFIALILLGAAAWQYRRYKIQKPIIIWIRRIRNKRNRRPLHSNHQDVILTTIFLLGGSLLMMLAALLLSVWHLSGTMSKLPSPHGDHATILTMLAALSEQYQRLHTELLAVLNKFEATVVGRASLNSVAALVCSLLIGWATWVLTSTRPPHVKVSLSTGAVISSFVVLRAVSFNWNPEIKGSLFDHLAELVFEIHQATPSPYAASITIQSMNLQEFKCYDDKAIYPFKSGRSADLEAAPGIEARVDQLHQLFQDEQTLNKKMTMVMVLGSADIQPLIDSQKTSYGENPTLAMARAQVVGALIREKLKETNIPVIPLQGGPKIFTRKATERSADYRRQLAPDRSVTVCALWN